VRDAFYGIKSLTESDRIKVLKRQLSEPTPVCVAFLEPRGYPDGQGSRLVNLEFLGKENPGLSTT
jgi:hypothetical protein